MWLTEIQSICHRKEVYGPTIPERNSLATKKHGNNGMFKDLIIITGSPIYLMYSMSVNTANYKSSGATTTVDRVELCCSKSYPSVTCHKIDIFDPYIHEHNQSAIKKPVRWDNSGSNGDPLKKT